VPESGLPMMHKTAVAVGGDTMVRVATWEAEAIMCGVGGGISGRQVGRLQRRPFAGARGRSAAAPWRERLGVAWRDWVSGSSSAAIGTTAWLPYYNTASVLLDACPYLNRERFGSRRARL